MYLESWTQNRIVHFSLTTPQFLQLASGPKDMSYSAMKLVIMFQATSFDWLPERLFVIGLFSPSMDKNDIIMLAICISCYKYHK